jgi:hypothetical protein
MDAETYVWTESPALHRAEAQLAGDLQEVVITVQASEPVIVHWGLVKHHDGRWRAAPRPVWPPDSRSFHGQAVQSRVDGGRRVLASVTGAGGVIVVASASRLSGRRRSPRRVGQRLSAARETHDSG